MIKHLPKEKLEELRQDINERLKLFESDSERGSVFEAKVTDLMSRLESIEDGDNSALRELDRELSALEADPHYSQVHKRDLDFIYMSILSKYSVLYRFWFMALGKKRLCFNFHFQGGFRVRGQGKNWFKWLRNNAEEA